MRVVSILIVLALTVLAGHAEVWKSKYEQFANIGMMLHSNSKAEPNAGRCLDIAWGTPDGTWAKAQLWGCKGDKDVDYTNQYIWRYGDTQTNQVIGIWHPWHGGVNYCLDVEGGRAFQGANVRWWKCNDADAQKWVHNGATGQWHPWNNRNLCLDAKGGWGGDSNGQELQLWPCTGDAPQKFSVARFGFYHSNLIADVERSCARQSDNEYTCRYSCRKEVDVVKLLFEGLKLGCGYFRNPAAALACITGIAAAEMSPDEEKTSCGCWCWETRGGGSGGRRPTVPPRGIGIAPASTARAGVAGVAGLIDVFMPNGTSVTMTLADAAAQYPSAFKQIKEFGRYTTAPADSDR